ncbi:hypothetical protein G9A89_013883 [Geosiphon pyriformis]|nr:hypothetical protein G9A89_013883 [Geosiphon pyriformis]
MKEMIIEIICFSRRIVHLGYSNSLRNDDGVEFADRQNTCKCELCLIEYLLILPEPFVGEYHAKVNRAIHLDFVKLFLRLIYPGKIPLITFARVGELAILNYLEERANYYSGTKRPQNIKFCERIVIVCHGSFRDRNDGVLIDLGDSLLPFALHTKATFGDTKQFVKERHGFFTVEEKDVLEEVEGKSAKSITVENRGVAFVARDPLFINFLDSRSGRGISISRILAQKRGKTAKGKVT